MTLIIDPTIIANTPTVTSAESTPGVQTTEGLVISKSPYDVNDTIFYKITNIAEGTLFKNDGITPILDGDFITSAEGLAGLKFTPINTQEPCTGGTITTFGNYTIHTFIESDDFIVPTDRTVDILVVGGGGGGGAYAGGGGGGGDVAYVTDMEVVATTYPIVVATTAYPGYSGDNSDALGITAIGGGRGGWFNYEPDGSSGSSGGGGCGLYGGMGGSALYGYVGGNGYNDDGAGRSGGGGGGAGSAGVNASDHHGGNGGNGIQCDITGTETYYGGGGGGSLIGTVSGVPGLGGNGGGGNTYSPGTYGENGQPNSGGGGGGGGSGAYTSGGSGIVIIRYYTPTDILGSFEIQSSISASDAGLGGDVISASIDINPLPLP